MLKGASQTVKLESVQAARRALLLISTLCTLLLAGCTNTPTTSTGSAGASHYVVPTDMLPINAPVATTGCGRAPSAPPGVSVNVTIAAHPAEAIGHTSRMYHLHLPRRETHIACHRTSQRRQLLLQQLARKKYCRPSAANSSPQPGATHSHRSAIARPAPPPYAAHSRQTWP
jgi:hypothetical protein